MSGMWALNVLHYPADKYRRMTSYVFAEPPPSDAKIEIQAEADDLRAQLRRQLASH